MSQMKQALQRRPDELNAGSNAATGSIDREMTAIPLVIVAFDHSLPIGQDETRHLTRPGFDATTVFFDIRAYDFDFNDLGARSQAGISPSVTRQHPRIYRVGDNIATQMQVVLRYGIGRPIACIVE